MKRTFITCLMAVGVWLTAAAGNTVTFTSAQGHPGDEVEVAMMLTNDAAVTAVEVLISLDDALRYVEGSAVLNESRSKGHQLVAAMKEDKLSIVIFSPALTPLQGTEGELISFKLKLGKEPANYTLTPEVVMSDAGGNAIASNVVGGTITLLSPKIEVSTPSIDYGRVAIRDSYVKTLSIRNSGTESLEITDITFDNTDFSALPVSCKIEAGSTQHFTLTYAPFQRGTISSNVTITSNAINAEEGKAVVKAQPYSVNELHVQHAEGISDGEVTVALKMNNMEPIAGVQCEFVLPDALIYVEGSAAVSSRCEGTDHKTSGFLQGNKLTLLLYSASNMVLPEGDGELMTFRVRLNGQSGSYRLNPQEVVLGNVALENMTSATSGEYVVIKSPKFSGANALNMGDAPITKSATMTYSVKNIGKVDLVIERVAFLAEGYGIKGMFPMAIAAGQSKDLTVSYTPTAAGAHKTTMQIYTNDPTNRMHSVTVSGKVYEPNHLIVKGENMSKGYRLNVSLENYTDIVAVQMDVKSFPGSVEVLLGERLADHNYLVTEMEDGTRQILIYSMNNACIQGDEGLLLTLDCVADEYLDKEIIIENIVLSDAKGVNYASDNHILHTARLWGDANGDGEVDVLDINKTLSLILGHEVGICNLLQMDANEDGSINVLDINAMLRIIFTAGQPASARKRNEKVIQNINTDKVL